MQVLRGFESLTLRHGDVAGDSCNRVALRFSPQLIMPAKATLRDFVRVTGWPLHEAIKAAGYNQLRSLGIADRGEIAAGQIADLVLVDESLSPRMTIVGGEVMHS